jgi:hypothetical protein
MVDGLLIVIVKRSNSAMSNSISGNSVPPEIISNENHGKIPFFDDTLFIIHKLKFLT